MTEPLQPATFEAPSEPAPNVEISLLDSPEACLGKLPGIESYLGEVALIPAMEPGFYEELREEVQAEKTFPERALTYKIFEDQKEGQHFAWVQLLRFLSHSRRARKETEGAVLHLDVCSSVPLGSELQRSLDFTRCEIYASGLIENLLGQEIEPIYGDPQATELVRKFLAPKRSLPRQLLKSHLRRVLYTIGEDEAQPGTAPEQLSSLLAGRLMFESAWGTDLYVTGRDHGHYEGRMAIDTTVHETDKTLLDMASEVGTPTAKAIEARENHRRELDELRESFGKPQSNKEKHELNRLKGEVDKKYAGAVNEVEPIGRHRAADVLYDICKSLAESAVAGNMARPLRSISIDREDPNRLIAEAERSFERETRRMGLYYRSLERLAMPPEIGDHHTADILDPSYWEQIPDNSVSLITSFEGFPLLFEEPEEPVPGVLTIEEAAGVLYQKLKVNGYLVLFAWGINGELANGQPTLKKIIANWSEQGADISVKYYRRDILLEAISNSYDISLIGKSAIFDPDGDPDDLLELMVVQKSEDAVRLAAQMRKGRVDETKIPDWPSPRP